MTEPEEWRPVVGWEGLYEVSSLGRVRVLDRIVYVPLPCGIVQQRHQAGRILALGLSSNGYLTFCACEPGRRASFTVHTAVCEAFHGPRPSRYTAAHNNGNRRDNRSVNLRWATRKDNDRDKIEHNTLVYGNAAPWRTLSAEEAIAIWKSRGRISQSQLAQIYGVTRSAIAMIHQGRTWKQSTEGLP